VRRQPAGPRRERSVRYYLLRTRLLGLLALAALVAGVVSDFTSGTFWERHALLAGLVASVIVVMLSVGVINEIVERRGRRRWSVLAQYVMLELVRNARMIWFGVLEVAGLLPDGAGPEDRVGAGQEIVRDTPRLTAALLEVTGDRERRARLHAEITLLAEHSSEVLSRWAAVMLGTDVYAEVIDRHVELAGDMVWIGDVLDNSQPSDDGRRQRRARSNPATQIWREMDGQWLADRMVVIVQLAAALDRGTLDLALEIVPVQWWESRLATAGPASAGSSPVGRDERGDEGNVTSDDQQALAADQPPSRPGHSQHQPGERGVPRRNQQSR
jgi:hypothetical protein